MSRGATCLAALALTLGALSVAVAPAAPVQIFSGFEHGFGGFNLGGVGDAYPTIVAAGPGHGKACRFVLRGSEERSELTLGGDGSADSAGTFRFREGAEYWYAFSFNVQQMAWGRPGAHNLFMQLRPNGDEGSPNLALALWDYEGDRGLWSEGPAMGGGHFLAPLSLRAWHRLEMHFRASRHGRGYYRLYLDGELVDGRTRVNTIVPGNAYGFIKSGLYRNGEAIHGKSVLLLDSVELSAQRP